MKIAIIGTGGVGGYYGAQLAQAGNEVIFIARGGHLSAIREKGLHIESSHGNIHLQKPMATDNPSEIASADLVLFCVKLWDTIEAAKLITPFLKSDTVVISLQNGVQKDDLLKSILGDSCMMGGVCYISATIESPGVIKHFGTRQTLMFGEYNGEPTQRAKGILDVFLKAGIDAHLSENIRKAIWEKFVFLVGLSGTTSAMRSPIGPICSHRQTRTFLLDCMQEVVDVGRAMGVDIALDFAEDRLQFCETLPEGTQSSMALDLKRGNPLEVSWLSGGVVEMGKKAGIPTPINRAINDILILHAGGKV